MFTQFPPPFPTRAAPEIIRDAMVEAAQVTQAPEGLVGSSTIGAVSLACQNSINVQRLEGLTGPCSLALLTIAESGERKSAVDNLVTKAIKAFDAEQAERVKKNAIQYKARRATWDIELKLASSAIEKAIKKGQDPSDLTQLLEDVYRRMPSEPACRKMLYDDASPAGFKFDLRHEFSSVGFFSAEAKSVIHAGMMKELSLHNKLWGGETIHVTRRSTQSFEVNDARMTTSLMFQPKIFENTFGEGKSEARQIGYFARTLVTQPFSTQGNRLIIVPISPSVRLERFNARISELLHQDLSAIEAGTHERKLLKFSCEAQQRWQSAYNCVELSLGAGGYLSDIKDFGSKFAENVARMAALFHRFEGYEGDEISLETLNRAGTICEWYLGEFKRLFSPPPPPPLLPQDQIDAMVLEKYLLEQYIKTRLAWVEKSKLLRCSTISIRQVARLEPAIRNLICRNLLSNVTEPPPRGRKPKVVYALNVPYFENAARQLGSSSY
ncbi:YfjI family protein [Dechloromonas sp. CZR5]|uniref:YfjI family protein n=1 Tax=Dechloromonas sp. CZR5 TaxID=2608630 RepID=UPI00123CE945|nr:YfjI family protein [Dechloromonas sp. CZR5]